MVNERGAGGGQQQLQAPQTALRAQASCSSKSAPRAPGILQLRGGPHVSFSDPLGRTPPRRSFCMPTQREQAVPERPQQKQTQACPGPPADTWGAHPSEDRALRPCALPCWLPGVE